MRNLWTPWDWRGPSMPLDLVFWTSLGPQVTGEQSLHWQVFRILPLRLRMFSQWCIHMIPWSQHVFVFLCMCLMILIQCRYMTLNYDIQDFPRTMWWPFPIICGIRTANFAGTFGTSPWKLLSRLTPATPVPIVPLHMSQEGKVAECYFTLHYEPLELADVSWIIWRSNETNGVATTQTIKNCYQTSFGVLEVKIVQAVFCHWYLALMHHYITVYSCTWRVMQTQPDYLPWV